MGVFTKQDISTRNRVENLKPQDLYFENIELKFQERNDNLLALGLVRNVFFSLLNVICKVSVAHHRARCLGDGAIRNSAQISSATEKKISQPFNSRPQLAKNEI